MPWDIFERAAGRYEAWYATPRGQRADEAERALLTQLLGVLPDRSKCARGRLWHRPFHLLARRSRLAGSRAGPDAGDAGGGASASFRHPSPVGRRPWSADARGSRRPRGLCDDTRVSGGARPWLWPKQCEWPVMGSWWSLSIAGAWAGSHVGGVPRRGSLCWARHGIPRSCPSWAMVKAAVGTRLQGIQWASTLFPDGLWRVQAPIPLGDVIGMAARMTGKEHAR